MHVEGDGSPGSGYGPPLLPGWGQLGQPNRTTGTYLYVGWRLSVHVVGDGKVPIEEGVVTGGARTLLV